MTSWKKTVNSLKLFIKKKKGKKRKKKILKVSIVR